MFTAVRSLATRSGEARQLPTKANPFPTQHHTGTQHLPAPRRHTQASGLLLAAGIIQGISVGVGFIGLTLYAINYDEYNSSISRTWIAVLMISLVIGLITGIHIYVYST